MQKITCDVNNCSHNNSGTCYADRVNMAGEGASVNKETCCGSFLDARTYSNLTNCASSSNGCAALVCNACECTHNKNHLCSLDSIQVSGGEANIYTETYCSSFQE